MPAEQGVATRHGGLGVSTQRSAAGKAAGIVSQVKPKALQVLKRWAACFAAPIDPLPALPRPVQHCRHLHAIELRMPGILFIRTERTAKLDAGPIRFNILKFMNYFSIVVAFKTAAVLSALLANTASAASATSAAGDPVRGARDFRPCMACHSVKSGEHSIGPSLAELWNRKAGTVEGFSRYTSELRDANIEWNESSLDKWLSAPQQFVPGTSMKFQGITDEKERADIIAYLKAVSENIAPDVSPQGMISGKRSRGG